uniref:Uncharacterized protein n=1 Tax=Romanomermis culicivorax TaxID=13658 RepID=A0A915JDP6_ROMCU
MLSCVLKTVELNPPPPLLAPLAPPVIVLLVRLRPPLIVTPLRFIMAGVRRGTLRVSSLTPDSLQKIFLSNRGHNYRIGDPYFLQQRLKADLDPKKFCLADPDRVKIKKFRRISADPDPDTRPIHNQYCNCLLKK